MKNETIYKRMRIDKHPGLHDIGCHGACCLRATDLGLQLGETTVFEHVDLHIHCGQIVALIGPNGAGKSSLLKAILGQVPHTGKLEFFLATGDKAQPTFGYVPQNPVFDRSDPISVLDLFVSCISQWPVFLPVPKALREKVIQCLARVHAEKLIDRRLALIYTSIVLSRSARRIFSRAGTPYSDFGRADVRRGYRWHETAAGYAR